MLAELQQLTEIFPSPEYQLPLTPSYEPARCAEELADPAIPDPDPAHTAVFKVRQNCVKINLVRPVDAPHVYHATMESKKSDLTVIGEHYWNLAQQNLITGQTQMRS